MAARSYSFGMRQSIQAFVAEGPARFRDSAAGGKQVFAYVVAKNPEEAVRIGRLDVIAYLGASTKVDLQLQDSITSARIQSQADKVMMTNHAAVENLKLDKNGTAEQILKVGNSYKKRAMAHKKVQLFPQLLVEIQKQEDLMKSQKKWDQSSQEWQDHVAKSVLDRSLFKGTPEEWKVWEHEVIRPYADCFWDAG
jgi:hypothetical protein